MVSLVTIISDTIKQMKIKIIALLTFVIMIGVNALANILPINGITTGQLSDLYPNIFAPIGSTFSIWGLIYTLLLVYAIYQFVPKNPAREKIIRSVNIYFIISSLANSAWIFSWHYKLIELSVILMLVILFTLIKISKITNTNSLALQDRVFLKIPFGVYFGWITVATIANITALLVSLGWKNYVFPDFLWMIIILLVGASIASITAIKEKNLAYGLVPIWAYYGIYLKHTSPLFFNNTYPSVISATMICILVFILVNTYLLINKKYI